MAVHDARGLVRVYADLQAGDGGKGRLVYLDCLQNDPAAVWRYNGGHNAGHTIVFEDGTQTATHIIPAGYFFDGCCAIIGKGCVLDPFRLSDEVKEAKATGRANGNLIIDSLVHVVLPIYVGVDGATDASSPETRRSTGRGVGPAYAMKHWRRGVRVDELLEGGRQAVSRLQETVDFLRPHIHDQELYRKLERETFDTVDAVRAMRAYAEIMDPRQLREMSERMLEDDRLVIAEGAQGAFLDVDFGEYPYTTSSSCGVGGTYTGTELPRKAPREVVGVFKPYLTRAGKGPVPSMIDGIDADIIRTRGGEKGTTTGLPRDIGWIDMMQLREAIEANDPDVLALTKLDVLSTFGAVGICVGYTRDGAPVGYPYSGDLLGKVSPEIRHVVGPGDLHGARDWDSLPAYARNFIGELESHMGRKIDFVGTGPGTEEFAARGRAKDIFRPDEI